MAEQFSSIVADEEQVARIIFSPSYIYNGKVAPTAFRWEVLPSGDAEDYISVLRNNPDTLEEDTRSFRARMQGDTRYGYALLGVGSVRAIGMSLAGDVRADVQAFPSKRFPGHAGIIAEIKGRRITALSPITPEQMMLQKRLAQLCSEIVKF